MASRSGAGLVAVAFLVELVAPAHKKATPLERDRETFPLQPEKKRDVSPVGLATEGEDRGRLAKSPSEIPAKGWKDILLRVYGNVGEHRILALAAGMTYYGIPSRRGEWLHAERRH
jgi:membrane protein